jgi:hypothetical protein
MIKSRMGSARHLGGIYLFNISKIKFTVGLLLMVAMTAVIACGGTETVEVIKEVQVEKIVEVKGDTIVEKVVETVKGDKEVVLQTVVVEKVVEVEAEVAPTFYGLPLPAAPGAVDPAPAPQSADGTVIVRGGLELRGSGMPGDSSGGMFTGQSVTEKLFLTDAAGNAVNQVVESWDLEDDLSKLTIVLKPDIPFHAGPGGEDFGVLTAADVAWSINTGNPGFNAESATDGGANWIAFLGDKEVLAIDTYTVEIPIDNFDIRWPTFILGQSGLGLSITSKTAYDTMGGFTGNAQTQSGLTENKGRPSDIKVINRNLHGVCVNREDFFVTKECNPISATVSGGLCVKARVTCVYGPRNVSCSQNTEVFATWTSMERNIRLQNYRQF